MIPSLAAFVHRDPRRRWYALEYLARRKLLCATLAWMSGIALAGGGARFRPAYALGALAAGILFILFRGKAWAKLLLWVGLALLSLILCALRMGVPALPPQGEVLARGIVQGPVDLREDSVRFDLNGLSLWIDGIWTEVPGEAYVWVGDGSARTLKHGDWVELRATLSWPREQRNPGGFDLRLWLLQRGGIFSLFVRDEVKVLAPGGFSVLGGIYDFNAAMGKRMDALFGDMAPLFRAMFLGDRGLMPDEWQEWFAKAGIVHLLSVSGLHVGFFYGMLQGLLRRLHPSPRLRFGLLVVLLGFYCVLTGLTPSVIRASIMLLILALGQVLGRKTDPMSCLATAALCILILRPLDLFAPGFQLSFGAMAGLILLTRPMQGAVRPWPRPLRAPARILVGSLAAQAGSILPAMACYGWIALLGLVTNLVAIPLSSLIFPATVPVLLLDLLWPGLARTVATLPYVLMRTLHAIAELAGQGELLLRLPASPTPLTVGAVYASLLLCSDGLRGARALRAMTVTALLAVGVTSVILPLTITRYVQLDVEQALAGVLHTQGACYVYDTGNNGRELISYLLYTGDEVDALFLSHGHNDHAGGAPALLQSMIPVGGLYISACSGGSNQDDAYGLALREAKERGVPIVPLAQGDVLALTSETWVEVLWPPIDHDCADANECSLVLAVHVGTHTLLLTGDVGADQEPLRDVDCDLLQVAHHGSRYSTSEAFLRQATPTVALVSAGPNNSFGHPHPLTLERLEQAEAAVFRTDECGAITVRLDLPDLALRTFCGGTI